MTSIPRECVCGGISLGVICGKEGRRSATGRWRHASKAAPPTNDRTVPPGKVGRMPDLRGSAQRNDHQLLSLGGRIMQREPGREQGPADPDPQRGDVVGPSTEQVADEICRDLLAIHRDSYG